MISCETIIKYIPQLIGVFGTMSGTLLGWGLSYITNNKGKIRIDVDEFEDRRSSNNQYAIIFKLFVYNSSVRTRYIRNIKILFCDGKGKKVFERYPCEGRCNFENLPKDKKNISIVTLRGHTPVELDFSLLIEENDYKDLSNVKKIYLTYESGSKKKKILKKKFCMNAVEEGTNKFF